MNLKFTESYVVSSARIKKALEKHMNINHEGHKSCEVCGEKIADRKSSKESC